jgi:site-specific recombinase XerD
MVDGKRVRRSLDTNDWGRALRRIEQLTGDGTTPVTPRVTFGQAIAEFLESRQDRNAQPSTVENYRQTLHKIPPALTGRPVLHIDAQTLHTYVKAHAPTPGTRRKQLKHLRTLFAWILKMRPQWELPLNPAKMIDLPCQEELVTEPLTREEVDEALGATDRLRAFHSWDLAHVRRRARALILVLAYSGLRIGDVARLRRSALERSGHLVLRAQKNRVPVKILLNPEACRALEALPAPGGNPTYFFWSGNGDPFCCAYGLWRTIKLVGKLAGIERLHPHRFRDTFAVELLTQGADIRTVQKLLGHKSVITTERHYAHFVAAHQALLDSATAKLDFTAPAGRPLLVHPLEYRGRNA